MQLDELQRALHQTDGAAILVPRRIVRRLLQAEYGVQAPFRSFPHQDGYFFPRELLFRHVEEPELDLETGRLLPATVLLLARPQPETLRTVATEELLLDTWRRLFHVRVLAALADRQQQGELTRETVRERVTVLGRSAFQEARSVLEQESALLDPTDDVQVYAQFCAVYLELRHFRPNLLATYFPALRDLPELDALLAHDVDAEKIFQATRLPNAPDPVVRTDPRSEESQDYYWKLMRQADRAEQQEDTVRAAILHSKAARVAPAALTRSTRDLALNDLQWLTARLREALQLEGAEVDAWLHLLPALLDKADQGDWSVESRLLGDLQLACREHERQLYALDLVDWILSVGQRPLQRPLTSVQVLRIAQHLRDATQRLTAARVSDADRQQFTSLLESALHAAEERARVRFRPILEAAFRDVGLVADNPPEQVAQTKMIEELLDHVVEYGYINFSNLRDTISRNQLKLADLTDPHAFRRGDPLLQLDRRLAGLMDGVYRRGEWYLRWLERLGSLAFGTKPGRFVCKNLLLPFGLSFLLLFVLEHVLRHDFGLHVWLFPGITCWLIGGCYLGWKYSTQFREAVDHSVTQVCGPLRYACWDLPLYIVRLPAWKQFISSWPWLLTYWYFLKPLIVFLPLYYLTRHWLDTWPLIILAFGATSAMVNSRFGYLVGEVCWEGVLRATHQLRLQFARGVFQVVVVFFKRLVEAVEYVLYRVNDLLRLQAYSDWVSLTVRSAMSLLWFPIAFLARLIFVVVLEPNINPIKLVLSFIVAKMLVPFAGSLGKVLTELFTPICGEILSGACAGATIFYVLPGFGAFLIWEIRENWRLYRANRPPRLEPAAVGHHGETLPQLLKPGFHSGTIPYLHRQLRRAENQAYVSGSWRLARSYRRELTVVARTIRVFVDRELLALLRHRPEWPAAAVSVSDVQLSCHAIRVALAHQDYPLAPVWVEFEIRASWLLAHVEEPGWLAQLSPDARALFAAGLAGLYKVGGVELVEEQMAAALAHWHCDYDWTPRWLRVWGNAPGSPPAYYDLHAEEPVLNAQTPEGEPRTDWPPLVARSVLFSRQPITWPDWIACWREAEPRAAFERVVTQQILPAGAEAPALTAQPASVAPQMVPAAETNGESAALETCVAERSGNYPPAERRV